jgi:adenylate cyclase
VKKTLLARFGPALTAAFLLTAILSFGILYGTAYTTKNPLYAADAYLSDALFQRESRISGEVAVVGIDARSLADFGPFPWPRDIMAATIEALNADPENRPAVIGVDVLYTGESDPDADRALAAAVGRYGNVAVAMSGVFGDRMNTDGDTDFYMENGVIVSGDEPYPLLKAAAAARGHVNALLDEDGVLRHGLYFIDLPDGERVYSLASVVFRKYAAYAGLEVRDPPVNAGGAFYIPYTALPGVYGIASVSDVIGGATLDVGGKIVLIGPYAAGLQDAVISSVDKGAEMYGVEVHANIVESLLSRTFKRELSGPLQTLVLFLVSVSCFLWFRDRRILPATIVWVLLTAGSAAAARLLYEVGYVTHALWLPFAFTVLYVVTVAANYIRASLEKRRVTNTFKRYVAPEIVNEILKEGSDALELGGKLTDIAVLFVDIRGFTPMSELLDAPRVVEILNRYLTLTGSCIMKNGGTLDKFIGDATMAFWGAPLPQDDCAFKAVKAALDMTDGSKALSDELSERFGRTVSFGVGIHFGPAVVGNIGARARMDYTAIGDTVNTAARLESNAAPGQILISRAVADAVSGRVKYTSLGSAIKLKGKSEGFEVLSVEGLCEQT